MDRGSFLFQCKKLKPGNRAVWWHVPSSGILFRNATFKEFWGEMWFSLKKKKVRGGGSPDRNNAPAFFYFSKVKLHLESISKRF